MTSKYMKACLSAYFRFGKSVKFIATEVGMFNSDFLAICKTTLIEVEIKTSKSDLNNDFKKRKHQIYETARSDWTPTQFYFAVPPELVDHAVAKCADKKYGVLEVRESAGRKLSTLMIWPNTEGDEERAQKLAHKTWDNVEFKGTKPGWAENNRYLLVEHDDILQWQNRVKVVKRAKKLTNNPPHNKVRHAMIARLSSEMTNLRIDEQVEISKNDK